MEQPKLLEINKYLWLRKYDGYLDFALIWHQDLELVWLIDGDQECYSLDLLNRMYDYLSKNGECYFIEIFEDDQFIPIGDLTLFADDFAIAIGDRRYWKKDPERQIKGSDHYGDGGHHHDAGGNRVGLQVAH